MDNSTSSTERACPADSGVWLATAASPEDDVVTCFPALKAVGFICYMIGIIGYVASFLIGLTSLYIIKRNKWVLSLLSLRSTLNLMIIIIHNEGQKMIWCEATFFMQILATSCLCCYIFLEARQLNVFIDENSIYTDTPNSRKILVLSSITCLPAVAWTIAATLAEAKRCWNSIFANLFWIIEGPRFVSLIGATMFLAKAVKKTVRPTNEYLDPKVRSLWSSALASLIIMPFFCLSNLNQPPVATEFSLIFRSLEGGLFALIFTTRFEAATLVKKMPHRLRTLYMRWNHCRRRRLELTAPDTLLQPATLKNERFGEIVIDIGPPSNGETIRFRREPRVRRKRRNVPTTTPPPINGVLDVRTDHPLKEFKINIGEDNDITNV